MWCGGRCLAANGCVDWEESHVPGEFRNISKQNTNPPLVMEVLFSCVLHGINGVSLPLDTKGWHKSYRDVQERVSRFTRFHDYPKAAWYSVFEEWSSSQTARTSNQLETDTWHVRCCLPYRCNREESPRAEDNGDGDNDDDDDADAQVIEWVACGSCVEWHHILLEQVTNLPQNWIGTSSK